MKSLALTLAFVLELVAFVGVAGISFLVSVGWPVQLAFAVFLFLTLGVFWSYYMAPRGSKKLTILPYYIVKAGIYGVAALVFFGLGWTQLSLWFLAVVAVDETLLIRQNVGT